MDGVGEYTGDDPRKLEAACTGCAAALVCMNSSTEEMTKPNCKQRCDRCGILFVFVVQGDEKSNWQCLEVTSRCPLREYKQQWAGGGNDMIATFCVDCEVYLTGQKGGINKWEADGKPKTKDFQKNVARSLAAPDL